MTTPRCITASICICLVAVASAAAGPEAVLVRLRAASTVQTRALTVGDVAEVTGGVPVLRDSIAKLDLTDVPRDQAKIRVSRKQLQFRLTLARLPAELFRIEGPDSAVIHLQLVQVRPDEVVTAARQVLESRLPWRPGEVLIDLAHPILVSLPVVAGDETVAIKAELHKGQRSVGRVQMDVRIFVQGETKLALPVHFNVRPCQKTVVCRKRVEKGEALDDANVYLEEQPVEQKSRFALSPEAVKGAKARRSLLPGEVVLQTDVETGEKPNTGVLIRAQESVKMQIRIGELRVTASGQALQEGRQGQLIRVQNVESKKTLLGRVMAAGLVEVE